MARNKQSLGKYWPIALLALMLAERAHAPLLSGALASPVNDGWVKPAQPAVHQPGDPKEKSKSDLTAPPTPDPVDPSKVARKLKEWNPLGNPELPWDLTLPDNWADPILNDPAPISLTHANQPTDWAGSGDMPITGADPGNPAVDPIPPATQYQVYGGDISIVPGPRTGPVGPVRQQTIIERTVEVPEPGSISFILGAYVLLGRHRGSRRLKS